MFEIEHLRYANQSYLEHLKDALYYSYLSMKASIIFSIHGLFPFIYTRKASTIINELNEIIIQKRADAENLILKNKE